ncbi:MAG: hypothetical protein KC417_00930, partial [Myxococcales bacterium]|nr:hypothetical protein [Myxococcales bacterium]
LSVGVAAGVAGCGGGARDANGWVDDGDTRYAVGDPGTGWSRVDFDRQNDLAWSNGNGGLIQVNANCAPDLDIPLEALTNHLLIGFTEREALGAQKEPFAGREALRTRVRAKLDGVPRDLELVVTKKDGCVYDFALVTPVGDAFAQSQPGFARVLAGFRTDTDGR